MEIGNYLLSVSWGVIGVMIAIVGYLLKKYSHSLDNHINLYGEKLDTLQDHLVSLKGELKSIVQVTDLKINNLEIKIVELKGSIDGLISKVGEIEGEVDKIKVTHRRLHPKDKSI